MRISPTAMDSTPTADPGPLLELAASDDVVSFRRAVEVDQLPIDGFAPWYGRWSSAVMGFEKRTPLMIAALYGSVSVLQYILSASGDCGGGVDVNRRCGSDSSTALHLAVAGGSLGCVQAVRLLLDAKADVDAVNSNGNKPVDVIPRQKPSSVKTKSVLEFILGGCSGYYADEEEVGSPVTPKQLQQVSPGGGVVGEKREYPVDATLPDIKSGIYGTDDFRMYTFKVKPCSRAYSHDWTECPFVHPGENARRRDPRKYHYSCVPCPEFRKGSCRNGDGCEYAHGVFESWLHPAQYRTRLCKDEVGCNRRVCFFAHKPEELRPLYNSPGSPGSVVSSPRSGLNLPPLDLGAAAAATAMLMNQMPMSPVSSSTLSAAVWLNQTTGGVATTPTMQLPSSRLKSAVNARDMDLDFQLLGLDGYQQQKLIDEIGWSSISRNSDLGEMFGSPDSSLMSPLKNFSFKQSASMAQFQSPSPIQKQLLSGYAAGGGVNFPSSPSSRSPSPSLGFDHSLASAIMNSRASSLAKRSQSFIDRGAINRHLVGGINSPITTTNTISASATRNLSDWGSPSGKLDWGIQGEELNKLRKSASFGIRSNGAHIGGISPNSADEPDISWVQSLVKDGPISESGYNNIMDQKQQQMMMMMNKKQQPHLNGGAGEFHPVDTLASWADQLYLEQEQLVA